MKKLLLIGSILLFLGGITLPMLSIEKLVIFRSSFSLLSGCVDLLKSGEIFLFFVLFGFSVLTPSYKYIICCRILFGRAMQESQKLFWVHRLMTISKWSMADVYIIAVLASTLKIGGFAQVQAHFGLFVFCLSVLSTMYLTQTILSDYELRPKSRNE